LFRIKTLYPASIVIMFLLFGVFCSRGKIPCASVNIIFALIAPAGYIYPRSFAHFLIFISWLVVYPALIFICKAPPACALAPVILFNLLMAAYLWYRNVSKDERLLRHQALNKIDDDKYKLYEERDHTARFENGIKSKEAEIANLYEITKKMSEHLKFEDMFRVFSLFLKENFTFRRCDLLLLDRVDDKFHIDRAYSVWHEEPPGGVSAGAVKNEKLIELFTGGFKDVWLTKKDNAFALKELGIEDTAVETFVVLPLLSERKMVGMLAVENLPKEDLERFVILTMQFALEIKKVLLYETVEKLAVTDSLTGLYVRRYFYERLGEELQRSKKYNFELAFIMVDIDDFKKCNDTYGHMVGDVVIKDIARMIKESVRDIDIVGRYGGEEFVIALPETGIESARQVAERLRTKVGGKAFKAYDENLKLTISMGLAIYPADAAELDDLIEKADQALYAAKNSGKNVVCEYKR
jgi:diguanylate cyclase (GGDEF)-like protein